MRIYVAGPMRGIPQFNFPAFDAAAERLRGEGHEVFNPADRDRRKHGTDVNASATGDLADVEHIGFSLRDALGDDTAWICKHADAIYLLDGWEASRGATAEKALAEALGHHVLYQTPPSDEVRSVSSSGGEKGVKLARYDLIPAEPLRLLATLYGRGAEKYDARNWERGYEWSKSFAALNRHLWAWWAGQDHDPETGVPHVTNVAWHAFALAEFMHRHPTFDDRPERA